MNLIILAAGQGKRLYPLTKDTPKSLLDLGDGTTYFYRVRAFDRTGRLSRFFSEVAM